MAIYEEYARVYDASGQIGFSLRMIPYLQSLLERHPISGRCLLELACGTGTVALAMAEAGWHVHGVDGSEKMLAQAQAKQAGRPLDITWSQQDMRSFTLPERVDLATCLYDSINYMLTNEDLFAVFCCVYRSLAPGGLFAFDMNTAYALSTVWNDETYFWESDDLSVVFQSTYDGRRQRATVLAVCFQRNGELYHKIVERHTEQAYPEEQVATLLTDAGFRVEARYDCFTFKSPQASTNRIMWLARRPQLENGTR